MITFNASGSYHSNGLPALAMRVAGQVSGNISVATAKGNPMNASKTKAKGSIRKANKISKSAITRRRSSKTAQSVPSEKAARSKTQKPPGQIVASSSDPVLSPNSSKASSSHSLEAKPVRNSSKLTTVLTMLRASDGTTIDAIMKTTGWQQHSVRGFLAGVVKKKLKLNLISAVESDRRIYRILPTAK